MRVFSNRREAMNTAIVLALVAFLPFGLFALAARRFPLVDSHEPVLLGVGLAALIIGGAVPFLFRRRIFGQDVQRLVIAIWVVGFAVAAAYVTLALLQIVNGALDRGTPREEVVAVIRSLPPSTLVIEKGSGAERKSRWLEGRDIYSRVGAGGAIALTVMPGALGWPWILDKQVRAVGDLGAPAGDVRPPRSVLSIVAGAAAGIMIIWLVRGSKRAPS
jgi:hypothetical protein